MAPTNSITPDENREFRKNGFLLLKSVLSPSEVATILGEVKRLAEEAHQQGAILHEQHYVSNENSYRLFRILRLSPVFDPLIDHPGYFDKLVSLLSSHIQLMSAEIFVRGDSHENIVKFHTDLGEGMQQVLPTEENAFLQIKAQIFLTDLSAPDSSNFALVPGSHLVRVTDTDEFCMVKDFNSRMAPDGGFPDGAVQILAHPGDVLLFTHTLWHAVAPNKSGRTRYSILLRYGQLALRPFERFDPVLTDPERNLTPRQRRVLGDLGHESPGPYRPHEQHEIIAGRFQRRVTTASGTIHEH
jgi:hypothetical protein